MMRKRGQDRDAENKQLDADEKKREEEQKKWVLESHLWAQDELRDSKARELELQKEASRRSIEEGAAWGVAYGQIIGESLGKGTEGFHNFLKGTLVMVVDFMEKKAIAAATANLFDNILAAGPVGFVKGFTEAAAIAAIAEGAKAGINSFYTGTSSAPAGPALVGEHGPERVILPRGAQVISAQATKAAQAATSTGHTIILNIRSERGDIIDALTTQVRAGTANVDRLLSAINGRIGR
jgi:hypothetical protein